MPLPNPFRPAPCPGRSTRATVRGFALAVALSVAVAPGFAGRLTAQDPGSLPLAQQLSNSSRAMALGDAYAMDSGHADALFYHPSLLNGARGMGLELQRWGAAGSAAALSATFDFLGGGVGIGLRTLQYGAVDGGSPAPGGQDHLFVLGDAPVSERIATVGYARPAFWGLDLGVALDFVDERVDGSKQSVVQVDVGLSGEVGPVTVGLTIADIGEKPIVDARNGPGRILLGAGAYGKQVGIFDVGFAARVGVDDDSFAWGGGLEVGYWPVQGRTFVARVGLQDVPDGSEALPLTTGFAFQGDNVTVEWAFRPFGDGAPNGGTHRLALRWR
jgi:hypothetical protein